MKSSAGAALIAIASAPTAALADAGTAASTTGESAIWLLANFCYAGMRAQGHTSSGWRIISFIFGLPGTLLSMLVITEGSERVYGVDLPRIDRSRQPKSMPADSDV